MLDFFGHAAGGGLGDHFEYVALHVELPAVVQAAQAAVFVTAVDQRGAAVRAVLANHADAAFAVAEHDKVFAEDARLDRCAVRFADLFNQADRGPVLAHQLAHGGFAFYAAQQFVFFMSQHRCLLAIARLHQ